MIRRPLVQVSLQQLRRDELGLSVAQVAQRGGLPAGTVSYAERGRPSLSVVKLYRLVEARGGELHLGVAVDGRQFEVTGLRPPPLSGPHRRRETRARPQQGPGLERSA